MRFDAERKFGVEIEFTHTMSMPWVAEQLRDAGINVQAEDYNHTTRTYWKIVRDSSCGFELVSPPLNGANGLQQVEIATEALKRCGATITPQCGLHVHHDASDYTVENIKGVLTLYAKYEKAIDGLMATSRRENVNMYCKSMVTGNGVEETLDRIKKITDVSQLENVYRSVHGAGIDRYRKVNIQSFVIRGTVEFRQHHGTLDSKEIVTWIIFSQTMMNRAKDHKVSTGIQSDSNLKQLFKAVQYVGPHQFKVQDIFARSAMKAMAARAA